jgi:hypothetical protein
MDQPPTLPESFTAPAMVVDSGASTQSWSRSTDGSLPMRREKKYSGAVADSSARSRPKRKRSSPSTKKGRFSSNRVSKSVRLTSAGSASTCPKSGFTVAFRTRPPVTRYLSSKPASPP